MNKRQVGSCKEEMAADYLINCGYEILERNYRDRYGEIDIIAKDGDYLVFIEVKYRRDNRMGEPALAVDGRKQTRIRNTARYYLYQHQHYEHQSCRFDVVSITGQDIKLIQDAF